MNLTNSGSLDEMRKISVENDLTEFKNLQNIASKLDDKVKMANNIDEARRKYNELSNLFHEDFLESSNRNVFEANLDAMEEILVKKPRNFEDLVTIYQASTECNDIYKRFRGENNE